MKRIIIVLGVLLGSLLVAPATPATAAPAWPVLRSGSTGSQVSAVQELLTARGYATAVDASYGPATSGKVVAFQRAKGLTADGITGAQTWKALVKQVQSGDAGGYVKAAQRLLNRFGYGLTVDGSFGPRTRDAVRSFQSAKGLAVDGIVGPITWQTLAGSAAGTTNPPATNCSSVTSGVSSAHTTVVTAGYSTTRVHTCLAPALTRLYRDAKAAGIVLGGWGFRTYAQQVELRKKHCGTSYYAIYEKPSSQCSPPTARPGTSMHEKGLAIDFNSSGGTLSSAAFTWLKNNAARYGLKNLPSERWHWSTTGG